jgi:hypothetical protein
MKLLGYTAWIPPRRHVVYLTAFIQTSRHFILAVPYCLN